MVRKNISHQIDHKSTVLQNLPDADELWLFLHWNYYRFPAIGDPL
jgi:hypothetical protein